MAKRSTPYLAATRELGYSHRAHARPATPTLANAATAQVDKPDASLTASWWKKFVAIDAKFPRPMRCRDRKDCVSGWNNRRIWTTRTCTTDKAKTFLVPLINVECSTVEGNGTTFEELRRCREGLRGRLHRSQACGRWSRGE